RFDILVLWMRTGPIAIPGEIGITCRGIFDGGGSLGILELTPLHQTCGAQGWSTFLPPARRPPPQHAIQACHPALLLILVLQGCSLHWQFSHRTVPKSAPETAQRSVPAGEQAVRAGQLYW